MVFFHRGDFILNKFSYEKSGVNIDEGNKAVNEMKKYVESTHNKNVVSDYGGFGGLFKFNNDTLVASTDGVGTKSILINISIDRNMNFVI